MYIIIDENCNELHEDFKSLIFTNCVFCYEKIESRCCSRLRIINDEDTILCTSGGQISSYLYVSKRMHFYEDMENALHSIMSRKIQIV